MIKSAELGAALVREGLLTEAQLRHALDLQRTTGGDLRDLLPKLGYVLETVLAEHIARHHKMHFIDPEAAEVDIELMAKIPAAILERHQIVALKSENGVLLALSDPDDFQAIDEVQFLTNRPVESALAPRSAIRKVLNQVHERAEVRRKGAEKAKAQADGARRLMALSQETLLRALALTLVEKGEVALDRLLAHAAEVESAARGRA